MLEINKCKLVPGITANWGEITGDITNQTDLVDYISTHGGGGSDAVWGQITGNLDDQTDLMSKFGEYVNWSEVDDLLEKYATEDWVLDQGYLVESDLSQYATRQWVTGRGYATENWVLDQEYATKSELYQDYTNDVLSPACEKAEDNVKEWVVDEGYINQIKTVNNQSLVGTGNIQISGLTPAQEEAISPLTDPSVGTLYTRVIKGNETLYFGSNLGSNGYRLKSVNIDGTVYYFDYSLYVWNPDKLEFEFDGYVNGSFAYQTFWRDDSGRFYDGVSYQLDFENHITIPVSLNASNYDSYNNRHNIWKGQYGIYMPGQQLKFNESLQEFESWPVTITSGYDLQTVGDWLAKYGFEYDGHFIYYNETECFELIEYEDRIEIEKVQDYFFPVWYNDNYLYSECIISTKYGIEYIRENYHLRLVDGVWENINTGRSFRYDDYGVYDGGDYFLGALENTPIGIISLTNMSDDDIEMTYWCNPNQFCVDKDSTQHIGGYKEFSSAKFDNITLANLNTQRDNNWDIRRNHTTAESIDITMSGKMKINGNNVATTDLCFVNRQELPYGPTEVIALNNDNPYLDTYWNWYWTTHTGRLFCQYIGSYYEFDGTQWNVVNSISINMDMPGYYVYRTTNNTFYNSSTGTYIWDDTNTDWVLIASWTPGMGQREVWPCGDTLRYENSYKLVENNGTYSWEQDTLNTYHRGMTYVANGDVYVLSLDDSYVYLYDELTKTYTIVGMYYRWSDRSFEAYGDIFFPYNAEKIMKIDFSKIDVSNPVRLDVETAIPYTDYMLFYGGYDDHIWYYDQYNHFCYCYDIQEDLPEVPSQDGTYVLQATRDGDDITYEWVSNQI